MAFMVGNCCGFIKLRTGCFIIGYIHMAFALYSMNDCIFGILKGNSMMRQNASLPHNDAWVLGMSTFIMYSVALVASIIELLFVILLLIGLHQNKRNFVKAYLIFNLVYLIINAVGFSNYFRSAGNIDIIMLIIGICAICATTFFLWVIRSYYIEMGKEVEPDKESEAS